MTLDDLIARSGRTLNAALCLDYAARFAAAASALSAIVLVPARALGVWWAGPETYAGICLAAAFAGFLVARARALDSVAVARCLDAACGTRELFAAACTARTSSFGFSERIRREADERASTQRHITLPTRKIRRSTTLALAILCVFTALFLTFHPQFGASERMADRVAMTASQSPGGEEDQESNFQVPTLAAQSISDSELAHALFPQDDTMADLATKALQNRDEAALEQLLRKGAKPDDAQRLAEEALRQAGPGVRGPGGRGQGNQGQAVPQGTPGPSGGDSPGLYGPNSTRPDSDGQTSRGQGDPTSPSEPGKGRGQSPPQEDQDHNTVNDHVGRNIPGSEGGNESHRGPVIPDSPDTSVDISDDASLRTFEIILGGKGPQKTLNASLPDSARAADSAVSRGDVPREYADAVRDYFLALSRIHYDEEPKK